MAEVKPTLEMSYILNILQTMGNVQHNCSVIHYCVNVFVVACREFREE
jgi:hypothetical protein